jgi:hypothetical protein
MNNNKEDSNSNISLACTDEELVLEKVNITLDFVFNTRTKELTLWPIVKELTKVNSQLCDSPSVIRTLTRTKKVYYILALDWGPISKELFAGTKIEIVYKKAACPESLFPKYIGNVHSKTSGRIHKLSKLYQENKELLSDNVEIKATYIYHKRILQIEKIN